MNRELDIECAHALGYTVYHYDKDYAENCYYMLMDAAFDPVVPMFKGARKTEAEAWADVPRFSDDLTAAGLLEDAIERRGLYAKCKYAETLMAITTPASVSSGYTYEASIESWWALIRATPEQRAQAFLVVVRAG